MNDAYVSTDARECGKIRPGKIYLTVGFSPDGVPFKHFVFDPAIIYPPELVPPRGLNIVKFQGVDVIADWIGANNYPNAADHIEETRRKGLHVLVERTFPFKSVTSDMFYMAAHPHGAVADPVMLTKYYKQRLSEEDSLAPWLCPSGSNYPLHVDQLPESIPHLAENSQWCAGLHWEALTDWDDDDDVTDGRGLVTRNMRTFSYDGRNAIPLTEFVPAFIMFFPMTVAGFRVYKDTDGEWEKSRDALDALPESMRNEVKIIDLEEAE